MEEARRKNIRVLKGILRLKGYQLNEKPYELNIVGVRHNSTIHNKFDDLLYVFWKNNARKWEGKYFTITTDPGTFWLNNPENPKGTAILKEGQYSYQLGLHKGEYEALVQQKPVTVFRDYDRNAILDFNNGKQESGFFGINIHRANAVGKTKTIDKYSAGCQVFEDASDFANFLILSKKHKDLYGNSFKYTLIDERAFKRAIRRRVLLAAALVGIAAIGYVAYRKYKHLSII